MHIPTAIYKNGLHVSFFWEISKTEPNTIVLNFPLCFPKFLELKLLVIKKNCLYFS